MANATGRPTAPLVLSLDERTDLERQVRRRRVAHSLAERCRIILRCADGLASKAVAAELGVHRHTLRKRIDRVVELIGRDLDSAHTRSELWIALKARELLSLESDRR